MREGSPADWSRNTDLHLGTLARAARDVDRTPEVVDPAADRLGHPEATGGGRLDQPSLGDAGPVVTYADPYRVPLILEQNPRPGRRSGVQRCTLPSAAETAAARSRAWCAGSATGSAGTAMCTAAVASPVR